jgi:hypothetical protein
MAWYRVYFLNSHGKIEQAQVIEADNDAAAVSMAELLLDSIREIYSGFDVWQGTGTSSEKRSRRPCPRSV